MLINAHDEYRTYYETIHVETSIRINSMRVPNVYFLVLFACCREGYTAKQLSLRQNTKVHIKPANFTMLFGCDPASGVPADTQLVKVLVQHLRDYFDPEDGSAVMPDCFGLIDAIESEVALESTSCNLGRSLKLKRQDNRIGRKQIIVITQD